MSITFKNIDLSNVNILQQFFKSAEEEQEFKEAVLKGDKENAIEEFWDCVQAKLGLLEKIGISAEDVMRSYPKHLEKIKNRPRN